MASTVTASATTTETTASNTGNGTGKDTGSSTITSRGVYDGQEVIMDKLVGPCVDRFSKVSCIVKSDEAMKFLRKLRNYKELEGLAVAFLNRNLTREHIVKLLKKHHIQPDKLHKDRQQNEALLQYLETTIRAVIQAFKVMTKKHK